MKSKIKRKISIKWKIPAKWTIFGLTIGVVIATVGSIAALNGWFGGGSSIPEDTMTRGLVGYWGFDEGSGSIAYDSSGYSNNGSTTMASWTKGKIGGALSFDGTDDYVDAGNGASLNVTNITISSWFKVTSYLAASNPRIISKPAQAGHSDPYEVYSLQFPTASSFNYTMRISVDGTDYDVDSGLSPSTGQWHHGVATFDGTNVKLYIDGILLKTESHPGSITTSIYDVYIGDYPRATGCHFNGLIDEVRIYNRALSADEVRYHYNRGGPVAHWKMDEGEGRTVFDSTDNNNDGTLVLAGSATSSAWVSGKYGSALSFDGVDDYVDAGNASALDFATGDFTIETWILYKGVGSHGYVAGKGQYYGEGYWLFAESDNDACLYITGSDGLKSACASGAVANDKWHHLVGIYSDADNLAKIYVDGEYEGKVSVNSPTGHTDNNFRMGNSPGTPYPFKGLIDEVRIYNYARTPDEIRLDYNAGFAAKFGYTNAGCKKDPASCVTAGLVGYWGLDEGSGTTAHDASNYTNNATSSGTAPSWTKGKVGGALSFDGVDDYVEAADSASLDITGAITLEAWVKVNNPTGTKYNTILGKRNANDSTYEIYVQQNTGKFSFYNGGAEDQVSTYVVPAQTWTHLVATVSDGNTHFYANGAFIQTITGKGLGAPNNAPLRIGNADIIYNEWFNGLIDEVRIYNRELSAAEVRYHYNRGEPVAQWKFDEGNGRTVYDSTDNNNDGTLVLAGSATSSAWVSGKHGTALQFDGINDYVNAGNNASLQLSGNFTISYWFNSPDAASDQRAMIDKGFNQFITLGHLNSKLFFGYPANIATVAGNTTLSSNVWYNYVAVWDGINIKLYLNGLLDKTAAITMPTDQTVGWLIGGNSWGGYYTGKIDDVHIYNYARTPEEIRLDYNAGFAAKLGSSGKQCKDDPASCMTEGLVGYWGFEEGSGLTAHDASNYANSGTLTLGPSWIKGKVGGALNFDGSDDYVSVADSANLRMGTGNTTIEAWVKSVAAPADSYPTIVAKGTSGVGEWMFRILTSDGKVSLRGDGGDPILTGTTNIMDNTWHHAVFVRNGDNGYIYVDGKQEATGAGWAVDDWSTALALTISSSAATRHWNGLIDEVRVYNRALSAEEVRYHYNRGGPVAQWKMDEGEGRTVYDSTENNNDGTLILAGSATSSAWVSGKYGGALSFDGVDDYVDCGTGASLNPIKITVEAWVRPTYWSGDDQGIISKGRVGIDRQYYLNANNGTPQMMVTNSGVTSIAAVGNTITLGQWSHVVGTVDGSQITVYVNGVAGTPVAFSYDIYTAGTRNLLIGKKDAGGAANFFNGLIDDVRIYNYARSASQIQQDYNAGLGAHFK